MIRQFVIGGVALLASAGPALAQTEVVSGDQGFNRQVLQDAELYDATDATVLVEQGRNNTGYNIARSPAPAMFLGGRTIGQGINRTTAWRSLYHRGNGACLRFENSPNFTVRRHYGEFCWTGSSRPRARATGRSRTAGQAQPRRRDRGRPCRRSRRCGQAHFLRWRPHLLERDPGRWRRHPDPCAGRVPRQFDVARLRAGWRQAVRGSQQAAGVCVVAAGRLGPGVQGPRLRRRSRHPVPRQRRHDGHRREQRRVQPAVLPVHAPAARQHRQHLLLAGRLRLPRAGDDDVARRLRAQAIPARPGGVDPCQQRRRRLGGGGRALAGGGLGRRCDAAPAGSRWPPAPDPDEPTEPEPPAARPSSRSTSGRSSVPTGCASTRTAPSRW